MHHQQPQQVHQARSNQQALRQLLLEELRRDTPDYWQDHQRASRLTQASVARNVRRDAPAYWQDHQRAARLTQASVARNVHLPLANVDALLLPPPPPPYPASLPAGRLSALVYETSASHAVRSHPLNHLDVMTSSLMGPSFHPPAGRTIYGPSNPLLSVGRMETPSLVPGGHSSLQGSVPPPPGLASVAATGGQTPSRTNKKARNTRDEFPKKLMGAMILHEEHFIRRGNPAFQWINNGRAFVVLDRDVFVREVIETHGLIGGGTDVKYQSFVRKMNRWGFQRATCGLGQYFHHPQFCRGMPELLQHITAHKYKRVSDCGAKES